MTDRTNGGLDLIESVSEEQWVRELNATRRPELLSTTHMVSEVFLCQTLIALWESGFYEATRRNERFDPAVVAEDLGFDLEVFRHLLRYLVGRGLLRPAGTCLEFTDRGRVYTNYLARGAATCYVGGYNSLLTNLGPLLRREISVEDSRLDRSGPHVVLGTAYLMLSNRSINKIVQTIDACGGRYVLDLGCGAAHFLVRLAQAWPEGRGVGIDMDPAVIDVAIQNSKSHRVDDRLSFFHAKLDAQPMAIPDVVRDRIDTVTAMYMLHEFLGRGRDELVRVLASLKRQLPGRRLMILEATRPDAERMSESPPESYTLLDYWFFHPLSRQGGLMTPDEWEGAITEAGGEVLGTRPNSVTSPDVYFYLVQL